MQPKTINRTIQCALLLTGLLTISNPVLAKSDHQTLALEYLKLSNIKLHYEPSNTDLPAIDGVDPKMMKELLGGMQAALSWQKVKPLALKFVMEDYTPEQLLVLNKMLKTEAGKLFVSKQHALEIKLNEQLVPILFEALP